MAKPEAQQQQNRDAREYAREKPTHLVAQSKTGRPFNRAGLRFDPVYRAIPLDQLSREQVERIMREQSLDARLCTEHEAEQLAAVHAIEFDESVTKRQLVDAVLQMREQLDKANAQIADLAEKIRMMSVDRKPDPKQIVQ